MATVLPKTIQDDEMLGRSVFSSSAEKRARRGIIIRDIFLVRRDDNCISVDRMDHASDEEMALLADARGEGRNSEFYGWATLNAADAAGAVSLNDAIYRRAIEASPLRENPYHANIVMALPDANLERRDIQKQHALALAANAEWRPRPHAPARAIAPLAKT